MGLTKYSILSGRLLYHATPLHYLPTILASGELLSQRLVGYDRGRPSARRRDRALQVDQYIHFSLTATTPLLAQKLELGYPHVVIEISSDEILACDWSILPCSTKAWRAKWQCQPVREAADIEHVLHSYDNGTRFRGLEVLVKDRVPLPAPLKIFTHSEAERLLVEKLCQIIGQGGIVSSKLQRYGSRNVECNDHLRQIEEYFQVCCALRQCLPPPKLPFD